MKVRKHFILVLVAAALTVAMPSIRECIAAKANADTEQAGFHPIDMGGKPVGAETLAGITSLYLAIDVSEVKLIDDKLDERQIYRDIQQMVRQENIRTLSREELVDTPGAPVLHIRVKAKTVSDRACVYSISFSLFQAVILRRDNKTVCLAATWYIPETLGWVPAPELKHRIKWQIKDGIIVFSGQHRWANLRGKLEDQLSDLSPLQQLEVYLRDMAKTETASEVLIFAALHGYKRRISITTGEDREEAKRMLHWAEKEYEQWKNSTPKEVEALIIHVTTIGSVVEEGELEPDQREIILKKMQAYENYAQERIKTIRKYEEYEGEFADIRAAYQKLSDATAVVTDKIKEVKQ